MSCHGATVFSTNSSAAPHHCPFLSLKVEPRPSVPFVHIRSLDIRFIHPSPSPTPWQTNHPPRLLPNSMPPPSSPRLRKVCLFYGSSWATEEQETEFDYAQPLTPHPLFSRCSTTLVLTSSVFLYALRVYLTWIEIEKNPSLYAIRGFFIFNITKKGVPMTEW